MAHMGMKYITGFAYCSNSTYVSSWGSKKPGLGFRIRVPKVSIEIDRDHIGII